MQDCKFGKLHGLYSFADVLFDALFCFVKVLKSAFQEHSVSHKEIAFNNTPKKRILVRRKLSGPGREGSASWHCRQKLFSRKSWNHHARKQEWSSFTFLEGLCKRKKSSLFSKNMVAPRSWNATDNSGVIRGHFVQNPKRTLLPYSWGLSVGSLPSEPDPHGVLTSAHMGPGLATMSQQSAKKTFVTYGFRHLCITHVSER